MSARVHWRGDAVKATLARAAQAAIDETTADAAQHAKGSHWWRNRTGALAGEIVSEPAERSGREVVGKFGTTMRRGFYGLFLERRTPFLRPAADQVFPRLAQRIKRRVK